MTLLTKSILPLLALSLLAGRHRFAPAPFGGIGTAVVTEQSALDRCIPVAWTLLVLDAATRQDLSTTLKYRTLLSGKVQEQERAFGPVILNSTAPLFQIVISQQPANDGLTVNEFTCTATGETVKPPPQRRQLNGLRVTVAYGSSFSPREKSGRSCSVPRPSSQPLANFTDPKLTP
ncbi:hypothetical protein [Deinococcus multiflagellatus]|uniref:Uncharacterized protein n=2 Tax=Deinococcus multiflagellatus TaxID=1656887 RepID=A0ABW1ZGB2_9DEIO